MAWDITHAGSLAASKTVGGNLQDLAFKPDGTKVYTADNGTNQVIQYPLSTAWDISTLGSSEATLTVSGEETSIRGVAFSSDGEKVYIVGAAADTVFQYPLGTPWDLSTAGASNASKVVSGETVNPSSIRLSADGSKMYVASAVNDVFQYPLSAAWDLSTAGSSEATHDFSSDVSLASGIEFKPDGLYLYISDETGGAVLQFPLSTPWDISSAGASNASLDTSSDDDTAKGVAFSYNGERLFVSGTEAPDGIYEYHLPGDHNAAIAWIHGTERDPIERFPRLALGAPDPDSLSWPPFMRRPDYGGGTVIHPVPYAQQPGNQHDATIEWIWGDLDNPQSTFPRLSAGLDHPMAHRWSGGVSRQFNVVFDAAGNVVGSAMQSRIFNSSIFNSRTIGAA